MRSLSGLRWQRSRRGADPGASNANKQRISTYYRAAAARGRSLLTKATTPWLRERLAAEIARCEHMAEEIEREREPDRKRGENREVPGDKRNPASR